MTIEIKGSGNATEIIANNWDNLPSIALLTGIDTENTECSKYYQLSVPCVGGYTGIWMNILFMQIR